MPTTSDGRWSPADSDDWDLTTDLAAMQVSNMEATTTAISTAVTSLNTAVRNGSPTVANQAERNALFPAPVQGNRVFRRDLGDEETYFQAHSPSTNPAGASVAGWYPRNRIFYAGRTGTQNLSAGTWNQLNSAVTQIRNDGIGTYSGAGGFVVTAAGTYEVSASAQLTNASAPMGVQITKNGGADSAFVVAGGLLEGSAQRGGWTVSNIVTMAPGDFFRVYIFTNVSNSISTGIGLGSASFRVKKL